MATDQEQEYFEYLQSRSRLGFLYRKYFLYPRLSGLVKGQALDFGCGIGDFLAFRPDTAGVDINANNIAFCQANGLDAQLMEQGVIPYPDSSFTSVVMDNVLEHIPASDADQSIDEVLRVLEPGGTLLIGVPGRKGFALDDDHKCYYGEPELAELLSRHGTIPGIVRRLPFRLPWIDRLLPQYCVYATFAKTGDDTL